MGNGDKTGMDQIDEIMAIAAHSIFDLGSAFFKGDQDTRAKKLLILDSLVDEIGTSVANDGSIREMTVIEIQHLVPELPSDEVFDLVRRMSQDDLLTCNGKYYQVAPLAAVLLQFVHFVARMQDESGSSTAVISSVFSYQLEVGSQNGDKNDHGNGNHEAIKAVIRDIGRLNAHLENTIRHSVLADLDSIVQDLQAVKYFCGLIDNLVGKMAIDSHPGDVFWLERARRVLRRLRELIEALQNAYSMRISKSLAGSGRYVTDEVLEKWLVHALTNEKELVSQWVVELDRPAYLSIFPGWLLLDIAESGPPIHWNGEDPEKLAITTTIQLDEKESLGTDDERKVTEIIHNLIWGMVSRDGEPMRASELVDPENWEQSAIQLCYLGTVISLLERDYLEKWAVDAGAEVVRFAPTDQVASITEAEIGEWTYLTHKKTEHGEL